MWLQVRTVYLLSTDHIRFIVVSLNLAYYAQGYIGNISPITSRVVIGIVNVCFDKFVPVSCLTPDLETTVSI